MVQFHHAAAEQDRIRDLLARGVSSPVALGWRYSAPAVVLGRGQRPTAELVERAARERVALVERLSGGGAVMAGPWMLSVTLLLPASHHLARASLPASYRQVGEACMRALSRWHIPVELDRTPTPAVVPPVRQDDALDWACFANVSHGELVVGGGRKIVGISQVRRRDAIAVCIGVLTERPDWETLARIWLGHDDASVVAELEARTASCDEFTPGVDAQFVASLADALATELPAQRLAA